LLGTESILEQNFPPGQDPDNFIGHLEEYQFYSPAVEIDECLLTHLIGDGELHQRQVWVVGIYDRATRDTKTLVTPIRTA
jgi:hypothetical protein